MHLLHFHLKVLWRETQKHKGHLFETITPRTFHFNHVKLLLLLGFSSPPPLDNE